MAEKPKRYSYKNEQIQVSFDGGKCAHAGYCFRELHDVFDGDRDPPIDLDGGSLEEIIRVVEKCPSSALTYKRLDGGADEATPEQVTATLVPNGPLALRGELKIADEGYTRLTLCRCGQSKNKPFCDGSHHHHQFDDHAEVTPETVSNSGKGGAVSLMPYPDGPVGFNGVVTVQTINVDVICQREKGAICRCGASKTKPFCDGSHKAIDFKT